MEIMDINVKVVKGWLVLQGWSEVAFEQAARDWYTTTSSSSGTP